MDYADELPPMLITRGVTLQPYAHAKLPFSHFFCWFGHNSFSKVALNTSLGNDAKEPEIKFTADNTVGTPIALFKLTVTPGRDEK